MDTSRGARSVMRAAGGLTLRRGDSAASSGPPKLLSVAVLGLSGGEKEKGTAGVGKSCLCNRFIQALEDNYTTDHISVFSQSDFSGRVVNNDHFLYWGDVHKFNEEGTEFLIQVIEQTEFVDDASFQPFSGAGKADPYPKRSTNTKLVSAEKLMYICKDQLGIEREYEQRLMPDGKFNVDGFIVVFDTSLVPNRQLEKQVEVCTQVLNCIMKTKRPVVVAATKCDEANELLVRELERLVNRKELKAYNIPVVETSAHQNINVDAAFFAVAQLVDKTRGRSRVYSYIEAAAARRDLLDAVTDGYAQLLRAHVQDYGVLWSTAVKKLAQFAEFQGYVDAFGRESAQRLFRRHVKKLKDEYLGEKVQRYFDLLPEVLHEMFPDFATLGEGDWSLIVERIRDHPDFGHFFVEYPEDMDWMEADLFDGDASEHRIPLAILEMPDAETVFRNHLNQLHAQHHMLELRQEFKHLLEEMGCVTPGKALNEVKVLFLGRESFESLPEKEILEIYDLHQREIIQKAKKNFQELLLERADIFYQFRSSPAGTITQDDILEISLVLQEDSRWKSLDRLDAERKLMLFQHLGFLHCPIREHCPAFPHCTDSLVERLVARKAARPPSWSRTTDSNHLNLVVLGLEPFAGELASAVKLLCRNDEFEHQNQVFSLDYRVISGDVALPENAFRTQDFLPHGCFCSYSDAPSFEYIRTSLEKTLLSNLEQEDRLPFQGLPLVIVFAADASMAEAEVKRLQGEGQALAESLQCPFMDVCHEDTLLEANHKDEDRIKDALVEDALRALIESIRHRSGLLNICRNAPNNAEPDIRIVMCLLCGDPYSVEHVLGPLLKSQNCYLSGERSLAIETQLGDSKRKVEVILSSYHAAADFRDELVHGFILVYSTKRKASLATVSAFSMNIPELPIQLLAVTENHSYGGNPLIGSELEAMLLSEGKNLADRLNAHFMPSMTAIQQKTSFYTPFFKEVYEKKSEIEHAFSMEDAGRLDDSGEGTLERPRLQPKPPPRMNSYVTRPGRGPPSGSGSDLRDRMRHSQSEEEEVDEDSEAYSSSHVDSMNRRNNGEHLVRPSQIKNRKKQQAAAASESVYAARANFFKTPSANASSTASSPPAYSRVTKTSEGSSSSKDRPPPPYSKLPPAAAANLAKRGFAPGEGVFYAEKGSFDYPPAPSTPPEPAPLDPANAYRDPRAHLAFRGGGSGGSLSGEARDGRDRDGRGEGRDGGPPSRARLVKASTMPASANNHASLDGEDFSAASEVSGSRDSLAARDTGWADDSVFLHRSGNGDDLVSASGIHPGAFTTGRSRPKAPAPPPVKPRAQMPGKLNMGDFQKVTAALSSMQVDSPLAKPRASPRVADDVDQHGYAVPRDNVGAGFSGEYAQPHAHPALEDLMSGPHRPRPKHRERREQLAMQQGEDSDSESGSSSDDGDHSSGGGGGSRRSKSSGGSANARPHAHHRKKGAPPPLAARAGGIPVAMPKVPMLPPQLPKGLLQQQQQERVSPPEADRAAYSLLSDSDASSEPPPSSPPAPPAPPSSSSSSAHPRPPPPRVAPRGQRPPRSSVPARSTSSPPAASTSHSQSRDPLSAPAPAFAAAEECESPRDDKTDKEQEKQRRKLDRELKQKQKDAERKKVKDEKRKLKEDKKNGKAGGASGAGAKMKSQVTLDDFRTSPENPIPVFLEKALTFIEKEGLDAEGLYRVPGNRAHVDLLFQKFDEDNNVDIHELDIAVNAVATAVKDFFVKRLPPILDQDHMSELETISMMPDKSIKILELGKLLKRLPKTNFAILKYIFQHFVRVAEQSKDNCMDSKNLAICWWPTLLQYEFGDLGKFEAMRPHLEDIVQTMIDQYRFLFCGQEEVMMV